MKVKREIEVQFPLLFEDHDDTTCLLKGTIDFNCTGIDCDTCYFSVKVFKEAINGSISN